MSAVLERTNKADPSTWTMTQTDSSSLENRILSALHAKGYPATNVELDPSKLGADISCPWLAFCKARRLCCRVAQVVSS